MLTGVSTGTSIVPSVAVCPAKRTRVADSETEAGGSLFGGMSWACRNPAQRKIVLAVPRLPGGEVIRAPHLNRRHLVFRAIRGPVGEIGGDHVGAGLGVVEGGINHAGL